MLAFIRGKKKKEQAKSGVKKLKGNVATNFNGYNKYKLLNMITYNLESYIFRNAKITNYLYAF